MRWPTILLLSLVTSSAWGAEPSLPPECDAEACAVPLKRGERAPFDGQLLTPQLAIQLGQRAESCDIRLKLDVEHAKAIAAIDLGLERKLRELEAAAAVQREATLARALEAERARWYERPPFVATIAVAASFAAVWAAGQLAR
ncbi:MAG TPA: hypothetical protein VLI71_07840 [Gammaproteobacteria bacterium]|nr:hypothetical protein [Gammaproteobacteria bacterium]